MTPRTRAGSAWFSNIAFLVVVALVAVAGLAFYTGRPAGTKYSAMLATTIGLYPKADVRILGVSVGSIDSLTPEGTAVRVDFHVKSGVKVPAGAYAAVVAPTVVSDRYLQLAPVYTGGPVLAAGGVIPVERTGAPPEWDDLLATAQRLNTDLGPDGLNKNGALSGAVSTAARNLDGNGQSINTTVDKLSRAITTLSANRGNLAGTITNLQQFTSTIKNDDGKVREFTRQFAQVSNYLAGERNDLGQTLSELARTLDDVRDFVHDNRGRLRTNVDQLSDVLNTVNHERLALDQGLSLAPQGLDGLVNAYDGASGTLHTRPALLQTILCGVLGFIQNFAPPELMNGLLVVLSPLLAVFFPNGGPTATCPALTTTPVFDQLTDLINSLLNPGRAAGLPAVGPPLPGLLGEVKAPLRLPASMPALGNTPLPLAPNSSRLRGASPNAAPPPVREPERPKPQSPLGGLLGGGL